MTVIPDRGILSSSVLCVVVLVYQCCCCTKHIWGKCGAIHYNILVSCDCVDRPCKIMVVTTILVFLQQVSV